ncbi:MAG: T9SS type A sorting domain-containing protein, partial [Bacteroidales bacterium]|nr:T9SS type A sorting domain-containing protein [Bacteroidales bacterium]
VSGSGITRTISVTQAGVSYNLTVNPTSLSYTANGESKTVTVTSNTSWTATSSASWLTVSPASGSNNGTITAVAAANTSTQQRTATITVSGSGITRTINVTQAGAPTAIDEEVAEGISVYPNPTSGMFTIGLGSIEGKVTCQIVNVRGAVIETKDVNAADGSEVIFDTNVAAGVYFVRIISGDSVWTERVVIEK